MTHYKGVIVIDLDCDHCGVSRLPWQQGCKAWRSNRILDTFTHTLHTILKLSLPAVSTVSTPFQLRLSPPVYTRSFNSFVLHFNSDWSSLLHTRSFNSFNSISTPTISTSSYAQFQQLRSPFRLRLIFASFYVQIQRFNCISTQWSPPLPTRCFNRFSSISTQTDLRLFIRAVLTASTVLQLRLISASSWICEVSTASTAFQLKTDLRLFMNTRSFNRFNCISTHTDLRLFMNTRSINRFNCISAQDWSSPLHEYAQYHPLQLYFNSDWSIRTSSRSLKLQLLTVLGLCCDVLWLGWMCDECTLHHETFLEQLYWHLAIKLYCKTLDYIHVYNIYNIYLGWSLLCSDQFTCMSGESLPTVDDSGLFFSACMRPTSLFTSIKSFRPEVTLCVWRDV